MDSVVAKPCFLRLNFFHLDNGSKNNNRENIIFKIMKKIKIAFFFLIEESNYIQASRPTANAKFVFDTVLTGWNISSKQTEFKMEILTELWLYCYYYHVKSLLSS